MSDIPLLYIPNREFLRPYIIREVGKDINAAIMISSTDIYEPDSEAIIGEDGALRSDSEWRRFEDAFLAAHPDGTILRAAPIVGTGMTGSVRRLAEAIYRGRFFHFPGNEARKSVIHASDVAKAVGLVLGGKLKNCSRRIFNITDCDDPTLHDLAEAIAFRLDNKRISNLSTGPQQKLGRLFYGKLYKEYTTDSRFNGEAFREASGFDPIPVCQYMRTHIYDDSSL